MNDNEVLDLLKKIEGQLFSLERKVDSLINKPQERSFNKDRSYPKPFVKYGDAPRHGKGYGDQGGPRKEYGPKKEFGQSRPFQKRSGNDSRGFSPKKKPFFNKEGASK